MAASAGLTSWLLAGPGTQVLTALLLVTAAVLWVMRPKHQPTVQTPPGPTFLLPVVGETLQLFKDPVQFMWTRYQKYGPTFKTHLLGNEMYVVGDPSMMRDVWRGTSNTFAVPGRAFGLLMGAAPHMAENKEHAYFRTKLGKALGPGAIDNYTPYLQTVIERHVDAWGKAGVVSLKQATGDLSMDYGVEVISGVPLKNTDLSWAKQMYTKFNDGLYGIPINLPGFALNTALKARGLLDKALGVELSDMVEAENKRVANLGQNAGEADTDPDKPLTMLEAQIQSISHFRPLTSTAVVRRALGNVVASVDTTRYFVFNTTALVAMSARVQAKLVEEQRKVVTALGSAITAKTIAAMPYLDCVVKEASRLVPPSNGGFRTATEDITVPGGYTIPKGSWVMWAVMLLHCVDPQFPIDTTAKIPRHMDWVHHFDEAFQPERWESEATKPKMYAPFGGGVHLCVGMGLVYHEVKMMLVNLLRRYEITLDDPDMLRKCTFFPGTSPTAGTDGLILLPRSPPIA